MRMRLVPDDTNINFFKYASVTFGGVHRHVDRIACCVPDNGAQLRHRL